MAEGNVRGMVASWKQTMFQNLHHEAHDSGTQPQENARLVGKSAGKQAQESDRLLGKSTHSAGATTVPVDGLLQKVNDLVQSHQAELHRVLDDWLRQHQVLSQHLQQEQCATSSTVETRDADIAAISLGLEEESISQQPKLSRIPESLIRQVEQVTGKVKRKTVMRQASASKCLFAERREEAVQTQTPLQRLTNSRNYEWFSGLLIFLNAIYIGYECEHLANRARDFANDNLRQPVTGPVGFLVLQTCFCILFSVELGLRWAAEGLCKFFKTQDSWWNILDVSVVAFSAIDTVTELVSIGQEESGRIGLGTLSVLRVLRVVRLVRVVKIIRVMRFFRELRMMIYSIFGSMKSLLWVVLVLFLTFYMFGIALTSGTITYLESPDQWHDEENEDLLKYFTSLGSSMLSLFMAMSGGNDWGQYYEALERLPWQYRAIFICFITFSVFAVVNIVTGVFVENAMQSSHTDREIVVHEEMEDKKAYLQILRDIFAEMDKDAQGSIDIDTFERSMDDERVIAYFNALKLDVSDARTLFRLLDVDSSEEVSIVEFLTGCFRLQGEARSLDTKIMRWQIDSLQEIVQTNDHKLQKMICVLMSQLADGNKTGELQAKPAPDAIGDISLSPARSSHAR